MAVKKKNQTPAIMKKLYIFILLGIISTQVHGKQHTVQVKNQRVNTVEFKYPEIKLPPNPTYDFEVVMPSSLRYNPVSAYKATEVVLPGWKLQTQDPSVRVSMFFDEPQVSPMEIIEKYDVKECSDSVLNKEGKKVPRKDTTWTYQTRVTMAGRAKLQTISRTGVVMSTDYTRDFVAECVSDKMPTRREAVRYFRYNEPQIFNTMLQEWYRNHMTQAAQIADRRFGFYERNVGYSFKTIGNKKHKEYKRFNQAVRNVKNVLERYSPTRNKAETERALRAELRYFDELANRQKSDKRRVRMLQYIAYYNKFLVHKILDNYDQALTALDFCDATRLNEQKVSRLARNEIKERRTRQLNAWDF